MDEFGSRDPVFSMEGGWDTNEGQVDLLGSRDPHLLSGGRSMLERARGVGWKVRHQGLNLEVGS